MLSDDIIKLVISCCDIDELENIILINHKFFDTAHDIIFIKNKVFFNKNLKYFDIQKATKIYFDKTLTNEDLNYIPNLTEFEINNNIKSDDLIKLKKLETVIFNETPDCDIIKHLTNLKKIKLFNNFNTAYITNLSNIEELDISCCNSILCDFIKYLPNLKKLDISYNDRVSDNDIQNLTQLEEINIISTNISDNGIKNLINLKYIDVCDGINYPCKVKNIKHLINLEHVDIGDNISCDQLQYLTKLKELKVVSNNINYKHIKNLKNIQVLDCCNSLLSDDALSYLPNLIELTCNSIMTDEGIKKVLSLEKLDISHNYLITNNSVKLLNKLKYLKTNSNISDETLYCLKNLKYLEINGCVSGITNKGINSLRNLEELYILNSYITLTITDEGIKDLTKLKSIITTNNMTNKGICNLKYLEYLDCYNSPQITDDGIKNLKNMTTLKCNDNITFEGFKNMRKLNVLYNKQYPINYITEKLKSIRFVINM